MRFLLVLLALPAFAQPSILELWEAKTIRKLQQLEQGAEGILGVAAIDLTTRRTFSYHGDTQFPQASSIKIPILIEMYRAQAEGKLRMTDKITLTTKDIVGGSGHLKDKFVNGSLTLTLKELVTAMMETSDNTATNQCIKLVGMANVNRTLDGYGLHRTRLQRIMLDSAAAKRDDENIATPSEMAQLAELIYRGRTVSEQASKEMLDIMRLVKAHFKKAIPNVDIASKPGGIPAVKCETGVVFLRNRPYALSVMTTMVPENSDMIEKAIAIVHAHFERLSTSNRYGHKVE
ncbi:MAG: serine hydrolase [Bryobacterales bacterium]|nr:serine hydrolase [Bryobacterales bacterium]